MIDGIIQMELTHFVKNQTQDKKNLNIDRNAKILMYGVRKLCYTSITDYPNIAAD